MRPVLLQRSRCHFWTEQMKSARFWCQLAVSIATYIPYTIHARARASVSPFNKSASFFFFFFLFTFHRTRISKAFAISRPLSVTKDIRARTGLVKQDGTWDVFISTRVSSPLCQTHKSLERAKFFILSLSCSRPPFAFLSLSSLVALACKSSCTYMRYFH